MVAPLTLPATSPGGPPNFARGPVEVVPDRKTAQDPSLIGLVQFSIHFFRSILQSDFRSRIWKVFNVVPMTTLGRLF